jgi:hypothetical protein
MDIAKRIEEVKGWHYGKGKTSSYATLREGESRSQQRRPSLPSAMNATAGMMMGHKTARYPNALFMTSCLTRKVGHERGRSPNR